MYNRYRRFTLFIFYLFCSSSVFAQADSFLQPAGQELKDIYLSLNVETLWIAGHHVNWQTGAPDKPEARQGIATHCSAFVAAACEKVSVYILRPPAHPQVLLANAQDDWLNSPVARSKGWNRLNEGKDLYANAQNLANSGKVVVAVYKNVNSLKPGHIALVLPENRTAAELSSEGPEVIMAGTHNHNSIAFKAGFKSHITSWPTNEIEFFVHDFQGN